MTTNTVKTLEDILGDVWDIRDLIERFEFLEDENSLIDPLPNSELEEFKQIETILEELKGNGGDEQWRGDWYPVTMIAEDYFTDYCQQDLEDCGMIPKDLPSFIELDWDATASNMKMDYCEIDINGTTYYYR